MSYNILIVEDEQLAYNRLRDQILNIDSSVVVHPQVYSIVSAIEWFTQNDMPDLIFMDIHLSDGSSFEIFNHVQIASPIIFTTAYDEYALKAFSYNSIHYLLKPIDKVQLLESYQKFKEYHYKNETLKKLLPKDADRNYVIKLGNKYINIKLQDINCFYSKDKLTFIHTTNLQSYPLDYSLDKVYDDLDENDFFRVNRHLIARKENIKSFATKEKSKLDLQIEPNPPVPTNVSSERSAEFKKWWGK